jgi:hypothetical protein
MKGCLKEGGKIRQREEKAVEINQLDEDEAVCTRKGIHA